MTTKQPTGTLTYRTITFTRTFRAPIDDVWAAVTEPERLERWIGTWTGDSASGAVAFRMTAEGEDAPAEPMTITECVPPSRLHLTWEVENLMWDVVLDLAEADGVTTLRFQQTFETGKMVDMVGPGWEYYLDRLVTLFDGGDVNDVAWGDYHPPMGEYYQDLATRIDAARA